MLKWILILILAIIVFQTISLLLKRTICLFKIKKKWKGSITSLRNPFVSVLLHDGKMDLLLEDQEKKYFVSILTTPFRKFRYHFVSNKLLEIILERTATHAVGKAPHNFSAIRNCYTVRKYHLRNNDTNFPSASNKYLILHPAPITVTKVSGNTVAFLIDNDELFDGFHVVGLKYFLKKILDNN